MTVATHRVVGVIEWPIGSEVSPEVLAVLGSQALTSDAAPGWRVVSLRLPLSERPATAVLSADVCQLRCDLQQLFDDVTDP